MVDHTKTGVPFSQYLGSERVKAHDDALNIAANLCKAKAEDEKDRVDNSCECDGTGDYSAYHSLKFVEAQILELIL